MNDYALLLLHFQRDICEKGGPMAPSDPKQLERIEQTMGHAASLADDFRNAQQPVLHCAFGRDEDEKFLSQAPLFNWIQEKHAVIRGSEGHGFCDVVAPQMEDIVFNGAGINAFSGTELHDILFSRGISNLVLGGFAAHWTVESTGRDAADRGYRLIIASNCCESGDLENKDGALDRLSNLGEVMHSSKIRALLRE
jgi:nicotinamidase-related amidase